MDKYLVVNKFIILFYLITFIAVNQCENNGEIVLGLLIYIIINMTMHIIKRVRWEKLLLTLSIIFLIIFTPLVFHGFILLLPVNIYEAVALLNINMNFYFIINGVAILHIDRKLVPMYMAILLFTFFFQGLGKRYDEKIGRLTDLEDRLRKENSNLVLKLNRDTEYENQLKYVSQLEERNKIAQEIHDNIGHTLSASLMQLEAANMLMDRDLDKSKSIVSNTINVLREGTEDIRATLRNIKPPVEQMGINRVKLLMDKFMKDNAIRATVVYDGNLEQITYSQWKVIYNNVLECLTNILKYAKASKVAVSINVLNRIVKVEVKDNGIGALNLSKGLGIRGIEERTEGIGGKVVVDGSNGFSVILLLPIN